MRRFSKCIISALILIIISTIIFLNYFKNEQEIISAEVFKTLETEDFNEEIYIYSSMPKNENEKFEKLWSNVLTHFDMRANNPIISFDKDGKEKEERQTDNGEIFIDFNKLTREDTYEIYVNINTEKNTINLQENLKTLEKFFTDLDLKYEVTVSIKGSKVGKLYNDEILKIKNRLLTKYNANLVSEFRADDMYSITAYSKALGRYMRIGGKKVNLSIAIRYSESDDKTYIYVATPVIRTEI